VTAFNSNAPIWTADLGDAVLRLDLAPGAPRILAPLASGSVAVLDAETGAVAARYVVGAEGIVDAQWIARDASSFAVLGWNGGASVVGTRREGDVRAFEDAPPLECIAVSPTGEFILGAGGTNAALWKYDGSLACVFDAFPAAATALAWNESADLFAVACQGGVHVWSAASLTPHATTVFQSNSSAAILTFGPGDRWLASGSHDSVVRFHDLQGKTNDLGAGPFRRRVRRLAWSPLAASLAVPNERDVVVIDMRRFGIAAAKGGDERAMQEAVSQLRPHTDVVSALAYHPTKHVLAVASRDGEIRATQLPAMRDAARLKLEGGSVSDLRWSLDGRRLLAANEDGRVACWRVG